MQLIHFILKLQVLRNMEQLQTSFKFLKQVNCMVHSILLVAFKESC